MQLVEGGRVTPSPPLAEGHDSACSARSRLANATPTISPHPHPTHLPTHPPTCLPTLPTLSTRPPVHQAVAVRAPRDGPHRGDKAPARAAGRDGGGARPAPRGPRHVCALCSAASCTEPAGRVCQAPACSCGRLRMVLPLRASANSAASNTPGHCVGAHGLGGHRAADRQGLHPEVRAASCARLIQSAPRPHPTCLARAAAARQHPACTTTTCAPCPPRAAVNLLSSVLDKPEWFWREADSYQSLYDRICE